jgi:dCMP deaminase
MDKWDRRFLDLALLVASWSKDPSTQVGAIIVDDIKRVKGVGFNGFARGIEDADPLLKDRNAKLNRMIHAEINAVLNSPANLNGCTMYLTIPPCNMCANFLIQTGIKRIVWFTPSTELVQRWGESWSLTYDLLREANIKTTEYAKDVT